MVQCLLKGIKSAYTALPLKDPNVIYFITDTGEIFVGDTPYGATSFDETALNGVAHDISWDAVNFKLTIPQKGDTDLIVNIPKDTFVTGGSYNDATDTIDLALAPEAGGGTISIPAADLIGALYSGGSAATDTISVAIDASRNVTGVVVLDKADIGLGNVDNTADSSKAVLSATKLATPRAINGVVFDGTDDVVVYDNTKEPVLTSAPTKATIADADTIPLLDSAADSATKRISYGNLKTELKNYIDAEASEITVVDNLTSTSSTSVLSAGQGKVLNDSKLAKNLGVEAAGKVLQVDAAGVVTPITLDIQTSVMSATQPIDQLENDFWLEVLS